MSGKIHITMNIDDNYARHCGVTMASILKNNTKNKICFHLLTLGVSDDNKNKLKGIASKDGAEIYTYDIDESLVKNMPNLGINHVTAASYCRLFISDKLPKEISKVIYLDCDLVARQDLIELWNTDITDFAMAGVEDEIIYILKHPIGYDLTKYGYVNAGVLLINLDYWRKNDIATKLKQYTVDNAKKIILHDQDVLNGALFGKIKFLDPKWNVLVTYLHQRYIAKDPGYYEKYRHGAYIAHFTSKIKPWQTIRAFPYFDEYYKYQLLTPWKGKRPSLKEMMKQDKLRHILRAYIGIDKPLCSYKEKRKYTQALKSTEQ